MTAVGHALPDEGAAQAAVERHFARQLTQVDRTLALGVKLLERNDGIQTKASAWRVVPVVMGLYAKALKTTRAIRIVISASLLDDSKVLCRTLAETTVAILYILQKQSPLRADEYLAHTVMRTKNVMRKWKKVRGLKRMANRIDRLADKRLDAYRHLGEERLKKLTMWYSGDPGLKETFKRVGLERMYHVVYLDLTGVQHVSDITGHVGFSEQGAVQLTMGSSDEGQINTLLHTGNVLLWTAMRRVSQKMKLGYEAEIEAMNPEPKVTDALRAWSRRKRARRGMG